MYIKYWTIFVEIGCAALSFFCNVSTFFIVLQSKLQIVDARKFWKFSSIPKASWWRGAEALKEVSSGGFKVGSRDVDLTGSQHSFLLFSFKSRNSLYLVEIHSMCPSVFIADHGLNCYCPFHLAVNFLNYCHRWLANHRAHFQTVTGGSTSFLTQLPMRSMSPVLNSWHWLFQEKMWAMPF